MCLVSVKGITLYNQIRYLLVLVNDLDGFRDSFSYLSVLGGLSGDVGAFDLHEKSCHQIGHRRERHISYRLLGNLAVFVYESLCLE